MGRMVTADELTEASFADANSDLSVVTELPKEPQGAAVDGKRTVLIVDDEPDIRKLLRRVFEDRGYRVLEADRGLVALRMVKELRPTCSFSTRCSPKCTASTSPAASRAPSSTATSRS